MEETERTAGGEGAVETETETEHLAMLQRLKAVVRSLKVGEVWEDVVHEVWIECQRRGVRHDAPFVTLKHMTIDVLRKERAHRHERLEREEHRAARGGSSSSSGDEIAARDVRPREDDAEVRRLLVAAELGRREIEVVQLRWWSGMSIAETAREMESSERAVRELEESILARLRQTMRREGIECYASTREEE